MSCLNAPILSTRVTCLVSSTRENPSEFKLWRGSAVGGSDVERKDYWEGRKEICAHYHV